MTTAQAIRDGVIEATLNHDKGWMQSKENTDIYCTREPQLAFHERIEFCLDLHNSSVKAMRFPPKSYNQVITLKGDIIITKTITCDPYPEP